MISVNKRAMKDPVGWITGIVAKHPDEASGRKALQHATTLAPLADELGRLENEGRRTSREIGVAKSRSADIKSLLQTMRTLGEETRTLQERLRWELEVIAKQLSTDASTDQHPAAPPTPGYFTARPVDERTTDVTTVRLVDSLSVANEYTSYVRAHPCRTSYHELALRDLITDTLGQRCHHLLAKDASGNTRGILPLVQLESRLFGNYLVSMPWFNYGGPLADNAAVSESLMRAAASLAREAGCSHAEIRETTPRANWTARTHKVSMTLALPDDIDSFERSLGASLRAQSSKAARAGCTYRIGGSELLDHFYRVFSIKMRDLGTPVHSRAFYEGLISIYGEDCMLAVVSQGARPLAAGFLLAHGDTLEIPWASSLRRADPLSVNMLLYRQALTEAIARGYRHFDFGRSSPGSPTWRFKKQWGTVEHQLHWHYWMASGEEVPGPSQDSPKYRLAVSAWRRMPVALTRLLGPPIVRGLP